MSSIMKGIVDEEVGGNYLYHSVQDADTAKAILNSGYFLANRSGSQPATDAQTPYPVVSFGRNINYQTSGANVDRDYQVVFVVDRRKLEANYKTLGTSQNQLSTDKWKTMGPRWTKSYDKNGDGKLTVDELPAGIGGETLRKNYFQPKAGGEFEEAVPVKSGKLPLKGILLGFYLVPGKAASKDPELLSNPLRLDMPKPNIFVKAKQEEPVNEEELDENLRKWFKEKWVRFGPDGKIRGACARGSDKEGKPKCLPQSKAHSLGKKGRKYAAAKKRREDPNPERRGKAKNVATKKKSNEEIQVNEKWSQKYKDSINCSNPKGFSQKAHCAGRKKNEAMNEGIPFNQCPGCRGPIVHESMMNEKKDACYHKVKARYKVWPSAYASGALVQCRKKGASNWGTGGKKNESSIMKGIVDESENVLVLYIDGKPSTKYAKDHEAKSDVERLQAKFPNKKFELKREMREGVIIGHDATDPDVAVLGGAGSYKLSNLKKKAQMEANELAKDVSEGKFKNSAYNVKQLANTLNTIVAAEEEMEKGYFGEDYTGEFAAEKTPAINPYGGQRDRQHRGAISETPTDNPTGASGEGGWRKYKPKSAGITESYPANINQYARDLAREMREEGYDWEPVDLSDTEEAIDDAREQLSMFASSNMCDFFGDYDAGEQLQLIKMFNKKFGGVKEDTAYAGGMGQGGNAGESYRKFKPKSAGTFKEDELDEACWKGYHKEGNKKMFGKTYPNCVKNTNEEEQLDETGKVSRKVAIQDLQRRFAIAKANPKSTPEQLAQYQKKIDDMQALKGKWLEEEQLDEKCWDSHKQVGMKKKGGKMVPNCVPKESAIMKGLKL